ncbi:hypothetical protein HPT27_01955 [Permianibacter sp. IMCC34836]|uniref:hypothetical protein n=1 Tax=Permianibacter fluminis TaxID=2738515 RepID=UPI001554A05F|nr:hypothetical protein [Permianibacter fluminis]NQD35766.1 hypothetical protein [Permianibacter fluminis]
MSGYPSPSSEPYSSVYERMQQVPVSAMAKPVWVVMVRPTVAEFGGCHRRALPTTIEAVIRLAYILSGAAVLTMQVAGKVQAGRA